MILLHWGFFLSKWAKKKTSAGHWKKDDLNNKQVLAPTSNYTATKLDEPGTQDTAGGAGTSS